MSDETTTKAGNGQDVPAIDRSKNQAADSALRTVEVTKREAILLIHTTENFPRGFDEEQLAISLGWSTEEVREALQVCAIHGLIEGPPDIELPAGAPLEGSPMVGIDDLLSPEEQAAARESKVPGREKGCLALGEEIAVLGALEAGKKTGFTESEAEAALAWATTARLGSILLDLVLDGHVALVGANEDGDMKFAALDANGELVMNGRKDNKEGMDELDLFLSRVGTEYVEEPDLDLDDVDFDDDEFDFDDDDCDCDDDDCDCDDDDCDCDDDSWRKH